MSDNMPERINVMKVITYDVSKVIQDMKDAGFDNPTVDDVVNHVTEYAKDDMGCVWGHDAVTGDLIFQDENGVEL